ncbi:MAG: LON peptidase substrate-binding domain-containing protein [Planctomycetes bacterium]|nr:LON peptidase substrate-binding domain-containing protein [Planctomycetota bacterium]
MDSSGDCIPRPAPPAIAPLFPLPGFFLFPGSVVPLHIFEPRYCQLIDDLIDQNGRLVLGTVPDEYASQLPGSPPVHPVAGLGEIARHEKLPDGRRYLIWLIGLARVCVREAPSDRLYRRVSYEPLIELPIRAEARAALRRELEGAIRSRCKEIDELPADLADACMIDILIQKLQLPAVETARVYAERDMERRAHGALAAHASKPLG